MKTSVKFILLVLLLTFVRNAGTQAAHFVDDFCASSCELSQSPSCDNQTLNGDNDVSGFQHSHSVWSADAELGVKTLAETYSSNPLRVRRSAETSAFQKEIILLLSNREEMLALDKDKLCGSDKPFLAASSGCDYYVFALRQIII